MADSTCRTCGFQNEDDAQFCDSCGGGLSAAPAARSYVAGRAPDADLVLDIPTVSAQHFSVQPTAGGLVVRDLGSANGTFLNSTAHRLTGPTRVGPQDVLLLGSFRLPVSQLLTRLGLTGTPRPVHTTARIGAAPVVLGRAPGCDVVVPYPQVSSRHARVTRRPDGTCHVEDLGSANGTFIDGVRITKGVLRPGGKLSLASVPVVLEADGGRIKAATLRGTIRLDAIHVARVVTHRTTGQPLTLLDDVTVSIFPSEFVGLMGPSGAGKTTFMLTLNGYEPPSSGRVLINGEDLFANFDRFRGLIGYVPQDDIIHKELTVRESLYYTARLRLPEDTSDEEIEQRIDRVLGELHLEKQKDQIIGSVEAKVLSGGQRKRVNLAQELITEPELLFLDEPTSGLSAKDTADVMAVLRSLADQGRTIVLTIHQPSPDVYRKMDHVLLLAQGGRLAFFGPTVPDSYEFMGVGDAGPDKVLENLETGSPEQWAARYRASPQFETYVHRRLGDGKTTAGTHLQPPPPRPPAKPGLQFLGLLRRYATVKVRDRTNLVLTALQAPLVAVLVGLLCKNGRTSPHDRATPLFIMVVATIFFACFNASREIVAERAIYRRERMVNLKIGPYILSKFALLATVGLLQVAILLGVIHYGAGLQGGWAASFAVLAATSVASTAMGLLLSSVIRSSEAAMAIVPMILIPQIVLSGFIVPLDSTWVKAAAAPMVSRWSVEALLDIEGRGQEQAAEERAEESALYPATAEADVPPTAGAIAAKFRENLIVKKGLGKDRVVLDVFVMLLFLGLFLGAAAGALTLRDRRMKG